MRRLRLADVAVPVVAVMRRLTLPDAVLVGAVGAALFWGAAHALLPVGERFLSDTPRLRPLVVEHRVVAGHLRLVLREVIA